MTKPIEKLADAWESKELRDKADSAYKAYHKAHKEHHKAMLALCGLPEQSKLDLALEAKRSMDRAYNLMVETYWAYGDHKEQARKRSEK